MNKKISVEELSQRLGSYLSLLEHGHGHFIIEQSGEEVAVLLSIDNFREIMQMLELLRSLEPIDTDSLRSNPDFPELRLLTPLEPSPEASAELPPRTESVGEIAAKLGIRIVK